MENHLDGPTGLRWAPEAGGEGCAAGEDCYCPRGPMWFTEKQHPPHDWNRSKDHYPRLRKDGGILPGNMRLMHIHCNRVDYSNLALEARLLSLRDADGNPLDLRSVDAAMQTHLGLLSENQGRLPKGRRAWKAASREAEEISNRMRSKENPSPELLHRWRARSSNSLREAALAARTDTPPAAKSDAMARWNRYVQWEESLPNRFDLAMAEELDDYNLHHTIYEATPDELLRFLEMDADGDEGSG